MEYGMGHRLESITPSSLRKKFDFRWRSPGSAFGWRSALSASIRPLILLPGLSPCWPPAEFSHTVKPSEDRWRMRSLAGNARAIRMSARPKCQHNRERTALQRRVKRSKYSGLLSPEQMRKNSLWVAQRFKRFDKALNSLAGP